MNPVLYIVLHIPKTAGSTLHRNFQRSFGEHCLSLYSENIGQISYPHSSRERLLEVRRDNDQLMRDYVAQHTTPGVKVLFGHKINPYTHTFVKHDVDPRYITFLRDPVERTISYFFFLKTHPHNDADHLMKEENWSLDEWLDRGHSLNNTQLLKLLPLNDLESQVEMDAQMNFQLTREHLKYGMGVLDSFWFVGLTENFHDDSHYLYGKIGANHLTAELVVNAGKSKQEVSPETRRRIAELNALDIELYEYAVAKRQEFLCKNFAEYQAYRGKALRWRKVAQLRSHLRPLKVGWQKVVRPAGLNLAAGVLSCNLF